MALIDGSKLDLLIEINKELPVNLPFSDLIFSKVSTEGSDTYTQIRFTAETSYPYQGTFVLKYNRLKLENLPRMLLSKPRLTPRNDLYEMLPYIKEALGINFSENDLENSPVKEQGDDFTVIMAAKPTSHGWQGACELVFSDLPSLSIPVQTSTIDW